MELKISEQEQEHIYGALLVANTEWGKVKKSLAKLNREDEKVDEEISLNAALRRKFNPRAEEEARERERAKQDPAQLSIEDQPASSGETGGGHPPGEIVKLSLVGNGPEDPPTNEALRDLLLEVDCLVLLSDIRGWTADERTAAIAYAHKIVEHLNAADFPETLPDAPDFLAAIALTKERAEQLNHGGEYKLLENAEGDEEPTEFKVVGSPGEELTFADPVEAEIKCARLNREAIKHADMPAELTQRWLLVGPWAVVGESIELVVDGQPEPSRWFVVFDGVKERAESQADAEATAARYNRSVAGRDENGEWRDPPVRLAEDAVQEIKAAAESTE